MAALVENFDHKCPICLDDCPDGSDYYSHCKNQNNGIEKRAHTECIKDWITTSERYTHQIKCVHCQKIVGDGNTYRNFLLESAKTFWEKVKDLPGRVVDTVERQWWRGTQRLDLMAMELYQTAEPRLTAAQEAINARMTPGTATIIFSGLYLGSVLSGSTDPALDPAVLQQMIGASIICTVINKFRSGGKPTKKNRKKYRARTVKHGGGIDEINEKMYITESVTDKTKNENDLPYETIDTFIKDINELKNANNPYYVTIIVNNDNIENFKHIFNKHNPNLKLPILSFNHKICFN